VQTYLLRRVLAVIPVMLVVATVTFVLIHLAPGDPASIIAGPDATPGDIARLRTHLGLDEPLPAQLLHWYGRLLRGDLGDSIFLRRPVTEAIGERLEPTLLLTSWATLIAVLIGVPAGIVSARNRDIQSGPYDNYIQTDASINPGNSGGPLLNTRGEVIGINSAIFSESGGSVGIGFAIPINLAKELMPQLESRGRVSRGWLGVAVAPVTTEAAGMLGRSNRDGAMVAEVVGDGPAARAGVRVGDVIVAFKGQPIRRADDLPRLTARAPVGTEVELQLVRSWKEMLARVKLGELPEPRRP